MAKGDTAVYLPACFCVADGSPSIRIRITVTDPFRLFSADDFPFVEKSTGGSG